MPSLPDAKLFCFTVFCFFNPPDFLRYIQLGFNTHCTGYWGFVQKSQAVILMIPHNNDFVVWWGIVKIRAHDFLTKPLYPVQWVLKPNCKFKYIRCKEQLKAIVSIMRLNFLSGYRMNVKRTRTKPGLKHHHNVIEDPPHLPKQLFAFYCPWKTRNCLAQHILWACWNIFSCKEKAGYRTFQMAIWCKENGNHCTWAIVCQIYNTVQCVTCENVARKCLHFPLHFFELLLGVQMRRMRWCRPQVEHVDCGMAHSLVIVL